MDDTKVKMNIHFVKGGYQIWEKNTERKKMVMSLLIIYVQLGH